MPRHLIKRYLPDAVKVRSHPRLKGFGERLHDPNLWHLNRRSFSGGVAVGLFCALLPLPGQMFIVVLIAMWARVNLPTAFLLIWTTNPLTIPPVYYTTYRFGAWMLGVPPAKVDFSLSRENLQHLGQVWLPLTVGSLAAGVLVALTAFVTVRLLWRLYILRRCRQRRLPVQSDP